MTLTDILAVEGPGLSARVHPPISMIKYTIYLLACALFLNAEAVLGCLPKGAAIADSMKIVRSISETTSIQNSRNNALKTAFFAQTPANKKPLLRMVRIRADSSIEVRQLRRMHLDIVNVRSDPDRPPREELLSGGFIVEAVATSGQLAKLKKMSFEVSEMPEKTKGGQKNVRKKCFQFIEAGTFHSFAQAFINHGDAKLDAAMRCRGKWGTFP